MMKIAVAVVLAAVAVSAAPGTQMLSKAPLSEQKAAFHDFVLRHGRAYETVDEFTNAFANFQATLRRVDIANSDPAQTATFGITKFADWTPEQFRSTYLGRIGKSGDSSRPVHAEPEVVEGDVADVDWRTKSGGQYLGAVRNQQQCGSCWAFSTAEQIASQWALAGNPLTVLSVQQIVDCDTTDAGCNGGDPPTAYAYVQSAGGLVSEQSYPYTGEDGQCNVQGAKVAQISGWKYIVGSGDVADGSAQEKMKAALQNQPVSICVEADTWQDYTGGVVSSNCGQQLDHCVIMAGFSTSGSQPYWIIRNSWGADWGEQGFIYVEIGQNLCGVMDEGTISQI